MTLGDGGVVWTSLAGRELGSWTLKLNTVEGSRYSGGSGSTIQEWT
jgi:hypothetical protein